METMESLFEKQYSLEAIDMMNLDNKDFILNGLQTLQVLSGTREWDVGYYYDNIMPSNDNKTLIHQKKFIDKLYSLEENLTSDAEVEGMIRHLPNETSILKLSQDRFVIFDHGEISSDNKVRKIRFVTREEFSPIQQVLLEQIGHKVLGLQNLAQMHLRNTEKLTNY